MAAAGRGATLDGRPIHVSEVQRLDRSLAAVGLPSNLKPDSPDLLVFNRAIYQCQSVRRTGSASLNLCYLAAGRFDVFWSFATKVWDIAAGVLMVREAGGIVTAVDGGPMHLDQAQFIASANPTLHEQLRRLVGETLNA
jgi:myo-inositol-1(or 4)-monophosphatase